MTCPHAQTTTLRWLYGELDDPDHAIHVAACPDCQAVCDAHLDVLSALPDGPSQTRTTAPASRSAWAVVGPLLAAAAALLVVTMPSPPADAPVVVDTAAPVLAPSLRFGPDALDARLDALDDELLALQLDLSTPQEVP